MNYQYNNCATSARQMQYPVTNFVSEMPQRCKNDSVRTKSIPIHLRSYAQNFLHYVVSELRTQLRVRGAATKAA
jgi:hypothetical protein